jgi:hypothetical protein
VGRVLRECVWPCIELMAGLAAERMLLGDDDAQPAVDDLRQARELMPDGEAVVRTRLKSTDLVRRQGNRLLSAQLHLKQPDDLIGYLWSVDEKPQLPQRRIIGGICRQPVLTRDGQRVVDPRQ